MPAHFVRLLVTLFCAQSFADAVPSLEERLAALEAKLEGKQQTEYFGEIGGSFNQLGPAASKIYFHPPSKWQFGISSEVFTFKENRNDVNRLNVLSVAPTLAARLHPRLIFNAQILFENGGAESSNTVTLRKGQSIVQMAYLDWLIWNENPQAGIRVGHQLIPIGWVNTLNESVTYFGVLKPELERELIPSSWHENGISAWVDRPRADIQVGIFNSLNAQNFRGETFLSEGRENGQNAAADDLMAAMRINLKLGSILIGGSMAFGNANQADPSLGNATFHLGELHARYKIDRFQVFGMYARGFVSDAESISIMNSTVMGRLAKGFYVEAAYDVWGGDEKQLWLFARRSDYNLHEQVGDNYSPDPALDKVATTFGVSFFPLPNLVLKGDYIFHASAAGNDEDEVALGVGFSF